MIKRPWATVMLGIITEFDRPALADCAVPGTYSYVLSCKNCPKATPESRVVGLRFPYEDCGVVVSAIMCFWSSIMRLVKELVQPKR